MLTLKLLLAVFFIFSSEPGMRCVTPGTAAQELKKSSVVFAGKVIERRYIKEEGSSETDVGERMVIKLAVEQIWKGEIDDEVLLFTSEIRYPNGITSMMAEDFHFKDEERYLVYANGEPKRLSTSGCTRTKEFAEAENDLNELNEGRKLNRK